MDRYIVLHQFYSIHQLQSSSNTARIRNSSSTYTLIVAFMILWLIFFTIYDFVCHDHILPRIPA